MRWKWILRTTLSLGFGCWLAGCAGLLPGSGSPDGLGGKHPELNPSQEQLQQQVDSQTAINRNLQSEVDGLRFTLMERDAEIHRLKTRLAEQRRLTDEAVQEVVRAKAKLRSIESRAEAVSALAEAEVAINAVRDRAAIEGSSLSDTFAKAETLLEMGNHELENENFGGALYLARQAKQQIQSLPATRGNAEFAVVPGEKVFSQPLPLKSLKRSNLRSHHSTESPVLTVLDQGTPLIAYSHKDDWLRVDTEDGQSGWIFRTLVGVR